MARRTKSTPTLATASSPSPTSATGTLESLLERILRATGTESDIAMGGALKGADHLLPGFVTLDPDLSATIATTLETIHKYAANTSVRRPCNFVLVAEPGSGKSHFVKCVAQHCNLPPVVANVASLDRVDG